MGWVVPGGPAQAGGLGVRIGMEGGFLGWVVGSDRLAIMCTALTRQLLLGDNALDERLGGEF